MSDSKKSYLELPAGKIELPPRGLSPRRRSDGLFCVTLFLDGKKVTKTLQTRDEDTAHRRTMELATLLQKQGCPKHHTKSTRNLQDGVEKYPDRWIYARPPYVVTVRGQYVGTAPDIETAREIRDKFIAELDN